MCSANSNSVANQASVLVFGGTTEGREIVEWLSSAGAFDVVASSLTEYGGSLVSGLPHVESLTGRLLPEDMETLIEVRKFDVVIDATHPYAAGVSASIESACASCGVRRIRIVREGEPEGPWTGVDTIEQAAGLLAERNGNVLLTTGSNGLPTFVEALADCKERLFVRILPVAKSIAMTESLGIPASHVIAMQGPFSKELNKALINEFGIRIMVTKASGATGGFWEKVDAAHECGIELVVVHRPIDEPGMSLDEAKDLLAKEFGVA